MADEQQDLRGYKAYWKRQSIKFGLSDAAKALGGEVRASHLSALEQGKPHPLTDEQIDAYLALLDRVIAEHPPEVEEEE
jgi:hypothetical protein